MTKTKNNDPQPNVTGPDEAIQTVSEMTEEAANVVSMSAAKGQRKNIFERADVPVTENAATKVKLLSSVHSAFDEAANLADQSGENTDKAIEIASKGATLLFQGRIQGIVSQDEISAILGDHFGWKGKGDKVGQRVTSAEPDATRGRTPFGMGEHIRKRIVRAVRLHAFVNGDKRAAGVFFEGLNPDDVQPFLTEIQNGTSLWTVYDSLAKLKSERSGNRPPLAFDPKRIAGLAAKLGENVQYSVQQMQDIRGLVEAYTALYRIISVIGRETPEEAVAA